MTLSDFLTRTGTGNRVDRPELQNRLNLLANPSSTRPEIDNMCRAIQKDDSLTEVEWKAVCDAVISADFSAEAIENNFRGICQRLSFRPYRDQQSWIPYGVRAGVVKGQRAPTKKSTVFGSIVAAGVLHARLRMAGEPVASNADDFFKNLIVGRSSLGPSGTFETLPMGNYLIWGTFKAEAPEQSPFTSLEADARAVNLTPKHHVVFSLGLHNDLARKQLIGFHYKLATSSSVRKPSVLHAGSSRAWNQYFEPNPVSASPRPIRGFGRTHPRKGTQSQLELVHPVIVSGQLEGTRPVFLM